MYHRKIWFAGFLLLASNSTLANEFGEKCYNLSNSVETRQCLTVEAKSAKKHINTLLKKSKNKSEYKTQAVFDKYVKLVCDTAMYNKYKDYGSMAEWVDGCKLEKYNDRINDLNTLYFRD